MDIIMYLIQLIQYQHKQICWLLNFICRYIPLKQWAFDDSHSPKYQKFKIDELPLITDFRQDWTYKELIPYYEKHYSKKIRPISRRSECDTPDSCTCPRCDAPKPFLYKNNGSKGQLMCKICDTRFSPDESRFSSVKLQCPHCGNSLVPKKDRKHFIVHKCVNPKCPYYLHNLKKVDKADLAEDYGKNKYKLHYICREFTMDFFSMDLNTLPKNASSLKFNKHNAHVMSLCLTLHVNLRLSLRKTSQALKDLYNINISHQQIANYCKIAAICIKPFVDQYPYEKNNVFTADETYIKIRGLDVHKEKIVACILTGPLGKPTRSEIREFTTLIPDMIALRDWIVSQNCHHVAMESTGIYWMPIYEILEDAFSGDITLLVVNARHMKNVSGKKTDMRDSEWISTLLRAGLLNGSFIPEKRIREFRDLNRYRKSVIRNITSQKNRIEKFLQSSGFRLSSFISEIFGASGRNIILHLMEHGQIDKATLDSCLKTKTRNRIGEILMSVNGTLSEHQKTFLKILMTHYNSLKEHLTEVETNLEEDMAPFTL